MKVILMQDVPELGVVGDIKKVATGYARNYLIPKGLAVLATPNAIKQAQIQQKARAKREAYAAEQATRLAEQMAALTLTFKEKAGPTGRLYGSVTTADIAEALEREMGVSFDKRKISSGPLREVGEHTVVVELSRDVMGQVRAVVQGEGDIEGEEAPQDPASLEAAETEALVEAEPEA